MYVVVAVLVIVLNVYLHRRFGAQVEPCLWDSEIGEPRP